MDTPDFGAIGTDAHALFNLINDQMNTVPIEDPRWQELYDMFRLVSVVCSLASASYTRQVAAVDTLTDQTAPYWPTGYLPADRVGVHDPDRGAEYGR